jgi:hypothetical protein
MSENNRWIAEEKSDEISSPYVFGIEPYLNKLGTGRVRLGKAGV